ncbi:hypothetical protein LTR36_006117 [Oleoguttula mirabilis]|uniref:Yeast cell wall synthesis Kre9/Knh1-like N-terminal domain-containing protein n=1 Tax=Oleoguttula mirabilis TaxID=1507867 RepID=A0AAV9JDP7_9PEZI|nr:hypothetical protein LTR36_006117 [Oleoguttula mirabilis]
MSSSSSTRDFSLFSLFTAGLACLIPFANAYTQPVGAAPKGNPISKPGLNSVVPVGESYTVTWEPTTSGTVTLVLLKGPSTDAEPQYAIAEKIENSGTYSWTPSTDLAPGQTGYGIQLIDDANGQYQYTTQFGISNPDYSSQSASSTWSSSAWASSAWASASSTSVSSSSESVTATLASSTSASATANATTSDAGVVYVTEVVSSFTTYCAYATSFTMANQTYTVSSATTLTITDCPCTITKPATSSATAGPITGTGNIVASTGGIPANSSLVYPTGSMSVPSSLRTTASASATASVAPIQTGAAAAMATSLAGLVLAAGVAVFAL